MRVFFSFFFGIMRCVNDNQFDTPHISLPSDAHYTFVSLLDDYFSGKHSINFYWALNFFMAGKQALGRYAAREFIKMFKLQIGEKSLMR